MRSPTVLARRARARVREQVAASRPASAALRRDAVRRGPAAVPGGAEAVHVLVGPPGAGNTGDLAMVEAFVENVGGRVVVVERHPGDLPVSRSGGGAAVEVVALPHLVYGRGPSRARDLAAFHALLDTASSLTVVGADMLDGRYSLTGSVRRLLLAELSALRGVPTRLLGFSWNGSPRPAAARALVAAARAGAVPLLRDPHSAARARSLGVPGVVETADVVFLATSLDDALLRQVRAATGARDFAVVNASSLVGRGVDQVGEYRTVVRHLVGSGLAVVVLPHVLRGSSDDLTACRAVVDAVPEEVAAGDVHLVEQQPTPAQVRALAAQAQVVVTGRMHLAIMSLMAGVPAVTFSTQGKVSGLMEALGVPELCVEPGPGMGDRVTALVTSAADGHLAARLRETLPAQRQRALENVKGLGGARVMEQDADGRPRSSPARTWLLLPPAGRKDWVDLAKGVAILAVILYHVMLFLRSVELDAGGMGRLKTVLEMLPMPVFIVIAGMFHARVVQWSLGDTWKRRLLSYAYLYLLWSVLRFAFYLLVPNVRDDGAGSTAESPVFLLLAPVWPTSSYWFIWALFLLTLLLWVVRRLPRTPVVVTAAVVAAAATSGWLNTGNVGWNRVAEYAVYFLVGAFFSRQLFDAVARSRPWVPLAGLAVWGLSGYVAAYVPYGARVPGVALLGQVGAVVATATAAHQLVRLRLLSWVSYLGARSLHLYLVHVFVIAVLAVGVVALRDAGLVPASPLPVLAVLMALVTVLSVLVGRLLGRVRWLFVPPLQLTGRRRRPPSAPPGPAGSGAAGADAPAAALRRAS